jgi:hypothetical protein
MGTTPCILACSFSSFEGQQIYFTVMPHPSIKNEDANTHRVCGTNWGMRPLLIFRDLSQDSVEARHHGCGSASSSKTILCQTPIRNLDSLDQDSGMLSCMSAILLVACQWHSVPQCQYWKRDSIHDGTTVPNLPCTIGTGYWLSY